MFGQLRTLNQNMGQLGSCCAAFHVIGIGITLPTLHSIRAPSVRVVGHPSIDGWRVDRPETGGELETHVSDTETDFSARAISLSAGEGHQNFEHGEDDLREEAAWLLSAVERARPERFGQAIRKEQFLRRDSERRAWLCKRMRFSMGFKLLQLPQSSCDASMALPKNVRKPTVRVPLMPPAIVSDFGALPMDHYERVNLSATVRKRPSEARWQRVRLSMAPHARLGTYPRC